MKELHRILVKVMDTYELQEFDAVSALYNIVMAEGVQIALSAQNGIVAKSQRKSAFMRYSSACARNTMYIGPALRRKKRHSSKRSPASLTRGTRRSGLDCPCQKSGLPLRHKVL